MCMRDEHGKRTLWIHQYYIPYSLFIFQIIGKRVFVRSVLVVMVDELTIHLLVVWLFMCSYYTQWNFFFLY